MQKKIINTEITENNSVIKELVKESIKRLNTREHVVVKVNKEDLEALKEYKDDLMLLVDSIDGIDIRVDNKINRGGCIVETDSSTVDSRLELRMKKLEREIEKIQ